MKLENYQIDGAHFLARNHHALLADDMGLGKTAQAIEACNIVEAKSILIICPASVKYHWQREFALWANDVVFTDVVVGKQYPFGVRSSIVILNYELLSSPSVYEYLKGRKWDVLICDEAHYLKTLTSNRSKFVLGRNGIVKSCKYKWMLTGTPIENRPVDLFPMLYVLGRHILGEYNTYEKFVMRYCDGYYDAYSQEPKSNGSSNEEELKNRLKGFMLRRTLEHQLPPTTVQIIRLQKNKRMESLDKNIAPNIYYKPMAELGALASLRQEVSLAKLPQCIDYIKDALKTVDKLVIATYHRSVTINLAKALKEFNPVKYFGGMSASGKERAKDTFINDSGCKVFIGQIQAAGIGLDGLQKVCHHMIFVEFDWIPFKQFIGRLRRKGQNENVVVQILVCKDTIEEQMLRSVNSKLKSINKILGDE